MDSRLRAAEICSDQKGLRDARHVSISRDNAEVLARAGRVEELLRSASRGFARSVAMLPAANLCPLDGGAERAPEQIGVHHQKEGLDVARHDDDVAPAQNGAIPARPR